MRLPVERKRVLELLVEYVHLSTAQVYQLLGAETTSAQRAVRRLLRDFAALHLIRRERLILRDDVDDQLPHWEYIYWLTPRGLRCAEANGLDPEGRGKAGEERSRLTLNHDHEITTFHLTLRAALGESPWWRQRELKQAFGAGGGRNAVNPDAVFFVGSFYYFLEIEKTKLGAYREGESSLLRKCRNYVAYADPGRRPYRTKWPDMEGFYVCFTVAGEARLANVIADLRDRSPYSLFLMTTEEAYRTDILGRIWRTPTGAERSLLD